MALELFGDWGFAGGENKTPDQYQDAQTCINFYPEVSPNPTSKTAIALLGAPGLIQIAAGAGGANPGTFGGPVVFANGDGVTTTFITGDPNISIEKVYVSDWEGLQTQYTTSRTNLCTYSQEGTHWTAGNVTIAANQPGAPDGTSTLNEIIQNTANALHQASSVGTSATTPTGVYSARWLIKQGTATYAECVLADQNGGNAIAIFNFSTNSLVANPYSISSAVIGAWTIISTTSYAIGNGFYAVEMTASKGDETQPIAPRFRHNNGTTDLFAGDGTTFFYGWGLMITQGTILGTYIPTTAAAVSLIDYSVTVSTTNVVFTNAPVSGALLEKQTFTPGTQVNGGVTPGSPGLWPTPSSITNLPVRGSYPLPGLNTALVVIANTLYLATITQQGATQIPGTMTLKNVGTLLTNSGPVSIRDNNAGGMAVIVDGANVYYYLLSGVAKVITFTGGVTNASKNISVTSINTSLVVTPNATITDTSGFVPGGTTLSSITPLSLTLQMSAAATNTNASDTITITIPVFGQITDPQLTSFTGASTVAFIDGWWIFSQPNSQTFYTNQPIYTGQFNATYFALKDGASDNLMAVVDNKELLWLIGERTTEIWYNAGGQYFPFQRLAGTLQQYGCKAIYSIARIKSGGEDSLIWYGRSERGENIVLKTKGYSTEVVSTPAISDAFATYTITSDAIGYSYEEDGHEFYVLTFPSADKTWVYDSTVPPQYAWTQRASFDPYANSYHRHRSNCFMNLGGMRIVGDYQNGALYQMTRAAYTDAGWPIKAQRRSPFIWNKDNRKRVQMAELQIEFSPGQGTASGIGSDPQARLRISRDYGTTYGEPLYRSIGQIGNYVNRCIWRKLGWSRGAVAEIEIIDPVKRDIVGATLRASGT